MKRLSLLCAWGAACLWLGTLCASARLGETARENEKRYGKPVVSTDSYPLIPNAEHQSYQHEGWQIRVAFLDGKAACLEYAKIRKTDGPCTVVIQPEEVEALLAAEAGGGAWTKEEPQGSSNPFKSFRQFAENATRWNNSNGSTATLKMNKMVLHFESPAVKAVQKTDTSSMSKF